MSYDSKFGGLFIARIDTIVTAIQNNDLIVSAPIVLLSNCLLYTSDAADE